MSVLNTLQYNQCLCILTLPKCNAYFIGQVCTIYRPEKSEMVQTVQIDLSINRNTTTSQIKHSNINLASVSKHVRKKL